MTNVNKHFNKMAKQRDWIDEKEAAKLMGYKPETLRKYVKKGRLRITYSAFRQRNYQYDRNDIQKFFDSNASTLS